MEIDTAFYNRRILTLEKAHLLLLESEKDSIEYEMFRSACVKEFEIILEQTGKLLKKALQPYFHSHKAVDALVFKELFRQAGQHSLLTVEEVERWFIYRDNRNTTAHDYGVHFADKTLKLLTQFIVDTKSIEKVLKQQSHA